MKATVYCSVAVAALLAVPALTSCKKKKVAPAAELVPQGSIVFIQMPDLARTKERWPKTSLAKIMAEPEVKAFLEKPKSKAPVPAEADAWLQRAEKIDVTEGFLAITDVSGNEPTMVAAAKYRGSKQDADAVLNDLREMLRKKHPDGKSDLVKHGDVTVETYAASTFTMSIAQPKEWVIIGNSVDLVKTTLDRMNGKDSSPNLASDPKFQKCATRVSKNPDIFIYAQLEKFVERLEGAMAAAGQANSPGITNLKTIEAIAATTLLDGDNMRDTLFVLAPNAPKPPAQLSEKLLGLTTPNTLLYFAGVSDYSGLSREQFASNPMYGMALGMVDQLLAARNLRIEDFVSTFGSEGAMILDWDPEATQPAFFFAMPVLDRAKADRFLLAIESVPAGASRWQRQNADGISALTLSGMELQMVSPTLGVNDGTLVFGLTSESVLDALRGAGQGETVASRPAYQAAKKLVGNGTAATGFVDTKAIFEKVYGMARPMLLGIAMFNPNVSQSIDVQKLPTTESVSRHLGPIAFSQGQVAEGFMMESVGPVTLPQGLVVIGAAAGAVAAPLMEQQAAQRAAGGMPAPGLNSTPEPAPSTPAQGTPQPTPEMEQ